MFWHYDFHTVFHTAELSFNSLGDFLVFWNYDRQSVFLLGWIQAIARRTGGDQGVRGGAGGWGESRFMFYRFLPTPQKNPSESKKKEENRRVGSSNVELLEALAR